MTASPSGDGFRGARILVVGGAGFVGTNLVRALLKDSPAWIHIVDNLLSSEATSVPSDPAVRFTEGSIVDDQVLRSLPAGMDFVFHLAAFHGNQNSIRDPLADHENGALSTLKLYERLRSCGTLQRVVYAAAGCGTARKTWDPPEATEEDAPASLHLDSPYQISKLIGELYSNYYFARHGLGVVTARFQNVYGPWEILGAGRWRGTAATVWRNVVPTFVYRALKGLPLVLENGGEATRDFIHVDDIVSGLKACSLRGKPGETYNLATGVETSIRQLAHVVKERAGSSAPEIRGPARTWDRSGRRFGGTGKARRELEFRACVSLEEGLTSTIEWTRRHLEMIDSCVLRHADRLKESEAPSSS